VRRQRPFPGYPSTQFNSAPFARKENTIMKKLLVSLITIGSRTDHQFMGTWR
jgi:hypothetical protein